MKTKLLSTIFSLMIIVAIIGLIIFGSDKAFNYIGSLGGCAFLIWLALDTGFSKWFGDKKEKNK